MASGTPSAQVRIPIGDFIFPPPPHLCSQYTTWGKNYPVAEKLSNYAAVELSGAGAGGPKIQKNLSAENCRTLPKIPYSIPRRILIHDTIFIHCRPILIRTYLNILPKLYPILIHCRNYTLS